MTPSFITSNHKGSCSVFSQRETTESTHFANIQIKLPTKKRPRGLRSDWVAKNSGCFIDVSVWKIPKSFSTHSVSRTFTHVYNYSRHFQSWQDAKILAIKDVSQTSNFVCSTCFGLVLFGDDNQYGSVIGMIRESETVFLPIVVHDKEPLSAVFLRGPSLLCLCESGSLILEQDGAKCAVKGVDFMNMSQNTATICNVEDDRYALLCTAISDAGSRTVVKVASVDWHGTTTTLYTIEDKFDSCVSLLSASLHRCLLFFSTVDGVVHSVDMVSGTISWRTRMQRDALKHVRTATLHNGFLVLSTLDEAEDFYAAHVAVPADSSYTVGDVKKLFSTRCDQPKENMHAHLYIPWKNFLLKVHSEKGTCCDKEDSYEAVGSITSSGNPSMFQIESYLKERLQRGLDKFLEDKERSDDKRRMMENVRTILGEQLGHSDSKPFSPIFEGTVQCIASANSPNSRRAGWDPQTSKEALPKNGNDDSESYEKVDSNHSADNLTVVETNCQLDRLRSRVIIETRFSFKQLPSAGDENETKELRAKLSFHTSDRISSVWSCNEVLLSGNSDFFSLSAACPLAIFTNSSNLANMTFTATIDLSNNHSQPIGLFTLASLLCQIDNVDKANKRLSSDDLFNSTFHVLASGGSSNRLQDLLTEEDISGYVKFKAGEHKTRLSLHPGSQSELATLIARLTIRAGDSTVFQSVPEPSKSSLKDIDTGIAVLEEERKLMHSISNQKNIFGYNAGEIMSVIEKQIEVDDAFGMIEEQQLWF
ncbi:unnamed protein product [Agarophyton chilense]